jgi:hypothetical protein
MESILSDIVSMGIEEGPVFFRMTAKVLVQVLLKGKAFNGKTLKVKSCEANACKGTASKGKAA